MPPVRGGLCRLYGAFRGRINLALAAACLIAAHPPAAPRTVAKGEPPLSAATQVSGGVRADNQSSLALDAVELWLEPDPATQRLAGRARLVLRAKAAVARPSIDLDSNFTVRRVTVDGAPVTPARPDGRPDGRIVLPAPLAAGARATVEITYDGTPHVAVNAPWDDGMVWAKTPGGHPWVASTTEGYGCDILWPCLDFPEGEPAVATLHITAPAGLRAPANGRLLGVDTLPDGRTVWHWRARQPNTYAIALNIGPYLEQSGSYRSRYGNAIPLHYWHLPGEGDKPQQLFEEFAPALDFFESLIGPYPFGDEKVGVVETPHKGMEHQTINAYGNGYAKAPEGFDWLFQHEFAHEWFANQMTVANWDDYWLHEGFATYMQPLYGRWREGEARYAAMMEAQRNQIVNRAPIVRDKVLTEEEVYEPSKGGAGTDIYYKGSWTLHTLRWLIGDRAFFTATRRLVYGRPDPSPGNFTPRYASTREFQRLVAAEAGRNLDWFFDVYLRGTALPVLVQERRGDTLRLSWRTERDRAFPMPIEIQVGDAAPRRVALPATLPVPAGAHVVIDPASRVLRDSPAVTAFQAWQAAQRTAK
ncbi:MAG: M1 family metallopeptidase [Sphingomonas adhaesiva]|uniref:M1 family metallopeptidase n=1 Tax=Sphingomonas adhaesiva TaxID=28212 RepID=UPI002FFC631A